MRTIDHYSDDELAVVTFATHKALQNFVFKVIVNEANFDYRVVSDRSVVVPKVVADWCRHRADELSLPLSDSSTDEPPEAGPRPSRAQFDAFIDELEQEHETQQQ